MSIEKWDLLSKKVFDTTLHENLHPSSMDNVLIAHPQIHNIVEANFTRFETIKVLDFGCGTGGFVKELSDKKFDKIIGLDYSESMIKIANSRNIPNAEFICNEIKNIEYYNYFDIVISIMVFQFIKDIDSVIKKINNLLKSNGLLIIAIHNKEYVDECLKRGYKFAINNINGGLDIIFENNVLIPIYNRDDEYYMSCCPENIIFQKVIKPEYTAEYINSFNINPKEPIHIPKYTIFSFTKKT